MSAVSLLAARGWLALAAVSAQIAAGTAGTLPPVVLLVSMGLTLAAAARIPAADARPSRAAGALAALVAAAVCLSLVTERVSTLGLTEGSAHAVRILTAALVALAVILSPTWRRPREHRLWLTMSAAIVIAATTAVHDTTSAVAVVLAWVTVLAAAAALQAHIQSSTVDSIAGLAGPPRSRGEAWAWRRWLPPVALPLAAGGLVFLALPGGLGGGDLAARIKGQVDPASEPVLTRDGVGVDTMGYGQLDLRVRGTLPTTPLLLVPSDSPPLWRGSVYATYSGHDWRPADTSGHFTLLRGSDVTPTISANELPTAGAVRSDRVTIQPGVNTELVWAPGVVQRLRSQALGVAQMAATLRLFGHPAEPSYRVTSVVADTDPTHLRMSTGPDINDPTWTQLPSELPDQVRALARHITAGAPSRYDEVDAVERYLRAHERYSLESPVPGLDEDAVDRFLFKDHIGFCEQFASAATVLLRSVGVPSRVVTGLAYGADRGRGRLLTAADAHAWVEVYYPGVGWSSTDPTAGVQLAPTEAGAGRPSWLRSLASSGWVVLAGVLVLIAVGLRLVVRGRSRRTLRSKRPSSSGAVARAFQTYTERQPDRRREAETAREYLDRSADADDLAAALAVLEQECYGAVPPSDSAAAQAVLAFVSASADLPDHSRRRQSRAQ